MTDEKIKEKVKRAIDNAAPDDFERVLSDCGEERGILMTTNVSVKKKRRMWPKMIVAACLVLALLGGVGGFIWGQNFAVASVVSIDVNPSIELSINKGDKVLSCRGLNEDAVRVLADMNGGRDLEGTKLDVAINALIGALLREGYLDGISSAILVSVEDNNETRSARIQQDLVSWIDDVLKSQSLNASVFSQNTTRSEHEAEAHDSNISTGKATLIYRIIEEKKLGADAFAKLSELSVKELWELLKSTETRVPIGGDAAIEAAKKFSGLTGDVAAEVDPDFDDVPAHYEVELRLGTAEYEYHVDAFSGEVLSGIPNVNDQTHDKTITEDEAKNAAVDHMKRQYPELAGESVSFTAVELDSRDGRYEIDFLCGGFEFEYDIDIYSGSVTDWSTDYRKPTENSGSTAPDPTPGGQQTTDIGEAAAKAAAFTHAGVKEADVTGLTLKREYDNGRLEYDIEFYVGTTEYEYEIDAETGAVLSYKMDKHESHHSSHGTSTTDIGEAAAKAAAFTHAGVKETDVTGLTVKREYDDGRLEYEIEFYVGTTEYEYTIDGVTGSVLEHKKETHGGTGNQGNTGSTGNQGSSGNTGNQGSTGTTDIGEAAAKTAAFTHAGVKETDVTGLKVKREYDDGRLEYEIEFYVGTTEYEYTIDGVTGSVLEHKTENHGGSTGNQGSAGNTGNQGSAGTTDIGEAAAKTAAFNHAKVKESDVTGLKVKREYDDGRLEYEIEFYVGTTEYEYTIDGLTGSVLEHKTENHGGSGSSGTTDIGADAAVAAALAHAGVARADVRELKVEREYERGRLEYEIEFRVGNVEYEYTIDGSTGAVLDHEADIDD